MRRRKRQFNKSREEAEKTQKAKEEITKSRKSLQKSEDALMKGEEEVIADLKAADVASLSNSETNETSKLHDALSVTTVNKQSVNVATMMLDTAKTNGTMQCKAWRK